MGTANTLSKEGNNMQNYSVYLAGGMQGMSLEECNQWRECVRNKCKNIESTKYNVDIINPNDYFNFFNKQHKSEREVREFDLWKVRKSDLIVVNFNNPNSIGTAQELAVAYEYRIPIIGLNESNIQLHPWLIECCNRIFDDIDEMISYIKDFYLT